MPRSRALTYGAAWVVTAAGCLGVAWAGVGLVTDAVTEARPAALSVTEVRAALAVTTSTTVAPPTSLPAAVPPVDPVTDSVPETSVAAGPVASPSTTRPRSSSPSSAPARPPTTAATAAPNTSSPPSTSRPSAAAEVRTYTVQGGSASLRFTSDGVTAQWATPNPGFTVEIDRDHGNGIRVEFRSDRDSSEIQGWWDHGPVDRVHDR